MSRALIICLAALVAAPVLAQEAAPDSQTAWKALEKEYQAAVQEFFRPLREAQAKGEKIKLDYSRHPNRIFAPRFAAFAKTHAGTDEAALALVRVVQYGATDEIKKGAVATLLEDHVASEVMKKVLSTFRYRYPESLDIVIEKSPHHDVKGLALLARAQTLKGTEDARALGILKQVREQYGEVSYFGRSTLAAKAAGEIWEIENLAVGKTAPEIAGEDLDGVPFKLSDYRGKVLMLDFWGDW
ncbi:MAG: TlpA family protein disulfide reductase [Planctomycetota bacterium]|jgi:hypothetical protein